MREKNHKDTKSTKILLFFFFFFLSLCLCGFLPPVYAQDLFVEPKDLDIKLQRQVILKFLPADFLPFVESGIDPLKRKTVRYAVAFYRDCRVPDIGHSVDLLIGLRFDTTDGPLEIRYFRFPVVIDPGEMQLLEDRQSMAVLQNNEGSAMLLFKKDGEDQIVSFEGLFTENPHPVSFLGGDDISGIAEDPSVGRFSLLVRGGAARSSLFLFSTDSIIKDINTSELFSDLEKAEQVELIHILPPVSNSKQAISMVDLQTAPQAVFTSPDRGPTRGSTSVRIVGDNFQPGAKVIWDGETLATTFINKKLLMVTTPPRDPGPISLTVINQDGAKGELKEAFTYEGPAQAPQVKLLKPSKGEIISAGGATFNISWEVTSNNTARQKLLLSTDNGATFPIVLASGLGPNVRNFNWAIPEELVTNQARLRLEVLQTNSSGIDVSRKAFKIVSAPRIKTVSPATSKIDQGPIDLNISGQGFVKDALVVINGARLSATVLSSSQIRVSNFRPEKAGSYLIAVRNPNGGLSRSFLFTVAK